MRFKMDIFLVEPTTTHEKQAMAYRQEFLQNGEKINGSSGFVKYENYNEWLKMIKSQKVLETSAETTPTTTYFTVRKEDNQIIGNVQIRHHLTEKLQKYGGHIGYAVRPTERKKGYGTAQLKLAIEKAKLCGLTQIMLSCSKDNNTSAKVMLNNGAIYIGDGLDKRKNRVTENYVIDIG